MNLDDDSFQSFRIRVNEDLRDTKNVLKRKLLCESLKYDLLEEVYTAWSPYIQADASIILGEILTNSSFSAGTMSSATLIDTTLHFTSLLDLLSRVRETLGTDLVVNEDKTVSFITRGSDRGARIRYAKNLKGIKRIKDSRGVANKIYGFGGGNPPAEIGQNTVLDTQAAEHIVETLSPSGVTITSHSRLVSSPDEWNGFYMEITRSESIGIHGSFISITDSIPPNQIILDAAFVQLAEGDYFRINTNVSRDPLKFVKDQASIDAIGEIKKAVIYNDIVIATNLLLSSDLSGTYFDSGDGEKDNQWTISSLGEIDFSKNTNQNFILNGTLSQHCLSTATDGGISQRILNLPGTEINYSLAIWIWIISGTVELSFTPLSGSAEPFASTGKRAESSTTDVWVQLLVEGMTTDKINGVFTIEATEPNTEWYLDSAVFERSAKISSPTDFYKISGARRIWDRSFDTLQKIKDIKNKYTVSLVDLFEVDPDNYPYDLIVTGDTVTVQDDDLSIDISARVKSKRWNVFEPQEAILEIDNFSDRFSRLSTDNKKTGRGNTLQLTQNLGLIKNARTLEKVQPVISIQKITRLQN